MKSLTAVMWLIQRILDFDDGLAVLVGEAAPPCAWDFYMLQRQRSGCCDGVRVMGGTDIPLGQAIIESREEDIIRTLGGWTKITQAFRHFRRTYPETWRLFEMACIWVRPGGIVRDGTGGMTAAISRSFDGITAKTQRRRRKIFIKAVALYLITRPNDEKFKLYDDPLIDKKEN